MRGSSGFTLLEALVTAGVGAMFLAVTAQLFLSQVQFFQTLGSLRQIQGNARIGTQVISSELQMAGLNPTGAADAGLVDANSNSVRFTLDANGDGDTADSNEDVYYSAVDTDGDGALELGRSVNGGLTWDPVVDDVVSLDFWYGLESGVLTRAPTSLQSVRRIDIRLECGTSKLPENRADSSASIRLRNLALAGKRK